MPTQRAASEQVAFMARAHHRGVLCPSECWLQIAEALTPATAAPILEELRPESLGYLLDMYRDRPPIAYVGECQRRADDGDFRAVCVQIVQWCEAKAPTELPSEPDGIIRVRVKDGEVVKWQ